MWVYLPLEHGTGEQWNRWYKRRTASSQQGMEQTLKVSANRILWGESLKEREGTSVSLRDGNKQPYDLPKKLDVKESDARWLCGDWPLRNRAQETCFRLSENPPKAVETNDESNYEGTPTACRRNVTSGSHVRSLAKSHSFHEQTVMGLIRHQKLKGRFA